MAINKGDLNFKITWDTDKSAVTNDINQINSSLNNIGISANKNTSIFSGFTGKIFALNQGVQLAIAAFEGLKRALDATLGSSIALEKQVAEITTLLDTDSVVNFSDEILKLQSTFGTGQADAARAYYDALSSGAVDAQGAVALLNTANKLAIGGVTTLTTSLNGLVNIMNAYGVSADDSKKISDALFVGMKYGKTTIKELSEQIGSALGTSKALGVSYQETIAGVAAITNFGISTSEAVSSLRAAMTALLNPTEDLRAVMKDLGIRSVETEVATNGFVNTLRKLINYTGGSASALTSLFGRIEALPAITAISNESIGKQFDNMFKVMQSNIDQTGIAFEKMNSTASNQLEILFGKIKSGFTNKLSSLLTTINPIIGAINNWIDAPSTDTKIVELADDFAKKFSGNLNKQLEEAVFKAENTAIKKSTTKKVFNAPDEETMRLYKELVNQVKSLTEEQSKYIKINNEYIGLQKEYGQNELDIINSKFTSKMREIKTVEDLLASEGRLLNIYKKQIDLAREKEIINRANEIEKINNEKYAKDLQEYYNKLDVIGEELAQQSKDWQEADLGYYAKVLELEEKRIKMRGAFSPQIGQTAQASVDFASDLGSALTPITAIMDAANTVVSIVQKLIDFIPNLLASITNVFNSLTDLPANILQGVKDLRKSIVRFVSEFIPELLKNLPDIVNELATNIPLGIIRALPKMIQTVIGMIPDFVIIFTRQMVTSMPAIAIALVRYISIELPKALVNGLIDAFKSLGKSISALFSGKNITKSITEGVKAGISKVQQIGKAIAGATQQMFSVQELGAAARNTVDKSVELITKIGDAVFNKLKNLGQLIWDGLVSAFNAGFEAIKRLGIWIWNGLTEAATLAWEWIKTLGSMIWEGLKAAFTQGIEAIKGIGTFIWEGLKTAFNLFVGVFTGLGTLIWEGLSAGLSGAFEKFKKAGTWIIEGLNSVWGTIVAKFKGLGSAIFDGLKDAVINVGGIIKKILGFAEGGLVPYYSLGGPVNYLSNGGVPKGSDTVPAMLTPGEFIMSRGAVNSLGINNLSAMNRTGALPSGTNNISINLTINTEQPIDERFIKNKLMPELIKNLRQTSLNGTRVLSPVSVR